MKITVRSSAKVNLTLDILGRRADGYHELASIVHTIGLWDTLTFESSEGSAYTLDCSLPELSGSDNLCLKAAAAWSHAVQLRDGTAPAGAHITLNKRIPSGAGLGGGSGNAAATLLTLNKLHGDALGEPVLAQLAAGLGADVPLFLRGGCLLMEGVGERIAPLASWDGWLVVVQPPCGLVTARVYQKWDELALESQRATPNLLAVSRRRQGGASLGELANALRNDLMMAAQALGWSEHHLTTKLRDAGALGASMSGSGSAAFGLFESEAAAAGAAQALERRGVSGANDRLRIWVAPFCNCGAEFEGEALATPATFGPNLKIS